MDAHSSDKHGRRRSTRSQFVALLYGQLAGAISLREIAGGLESHSARLYHVGAKPASRSTLADANAKRSSAVFAGLFAQMVAGASRGLCRAMGEATHLIDATGVRLSGAGSQWARFSHQACGAKVHVVYDAGTERPIYAAVTPANVNDITAAKAMPVEPGATSKNAVRIQIAVALIAFLLLRMAQADQKTVHSPLAFARPVRANLMHRRRTDTLLRPPPDQRTSQTQLVLQWP